MKPLFTLVFSFFIFWGSAQPDSLYSICKFNPKKNISDKKETVLKLLPNPMPPGSFSICGNGKFRIIYMDIVNSTGIGFDDAALGADRMSCVCKVFQYLDNVIDIPSNIGTTDPTIDIIFNPSLQTTSGTLAAATPVFPPGFASTPGYYGGYVYDYIMTGVKPDPLWEDGVITVDFGTTGSPKKYNYCEAVFNDDCAYDFFSVILHEVTHLLGFASFLHDNSGVTQSIINPSVFSRMDEACLYYESPSLVKMVDISTFSGNGGINPVVTSATNPLATNRVWMYNNSLTTSRENQPVYSGIGFMPGTSMSHFDRGYVSRTNVSPGFSPNYVMDGFLSKSQFKRQFVSQDLDWLQHMGYTIKATYSDFPLLSNTPPYTLGNVILPNFSNNYPYQNPPAGNSNLSFSTTNCSPVTINLASLGLVDNEGDPITIYQPRPGVKGLYNIRGCGNGNNTNQLSLNASRNQITFYPRNNFIGRAQFAFHLYDGRERGSYIVITIDVTRDNCFENTPPTELVINSNLEEGIQYREAGADEKATVVDEIDISDHYGRGWPFMDGMQYVHFGAQDPYMRNSYKKCLFRGPGVSFNSPGTAISPPGNIGNRYVHTVFNPSGNEAFNITLSEPISNVCSGQYIFECDVYVTTVAVPNPQLRIGFNNSFNASPNPTPAQNQTLNIPTTLTGTWEHITFPFTYTSGIPSAFMFINGAFSAGSSTVYFDNISLRKANGAMAIVPLNDAVICSSGSPSSVVVGNSPGATGGNTPYTYAWTPATGLSCTNCATPTASPASTTMYRLTVTDANGCIVRDSLTVTRINCVCSGAGITNVTNYNWGNSFTAPTATVNALGANAIVTGNNVVLNNIVLSIAPTVTIRVKSGAKLTLNHCHLYACNNMWQGIIVEPGGSLEIIGGTLIEDAVIATDISLNTSSSTVLNIDGAIFNKNRTGININNYQFIITPYPFIVKDAVFTSRTLPFTTTTWPTTAYLKTLTSIGTLNERYTVGSYGFTTMKTPYSGQKPASGITLTDVGGVVNISGINYYSDIVIGDENGNSSKMNLFDNLVNGIDASNSNLTVYSNAFQYIQKVSGANGFAIRADDPGASTTLNRLRVLPNTQNIWNFFYDCTRGIETNNYDEIHVHKTDMRSTQQPVTSYPVQGEYGINIKTPHCTLISVQENVLTNIRYGIIFIADVIGTTSQSQSIGPVSIIENTIRAHAPGGTTANPMPYLGIMADNLINYTSATLLANGNITITSNHLHDVHNGIVSNNWMSNHFGPNLYNFLYVTYNYVRLKGYTISGASSAPQLGIQTTNCYNPRVNNNNVLGFTGANTNLNVMGIYHGNNLIMGSLPIRQSVSCNTSKDLGKGIIMAGSQWVKFYNNTMDNCLRGFELNNSASAFFQDIGYTFAYDNRWTNFTLGTQFKTYAEASDASNGVLAVRQGVSPYDPADNAAYNGASVAGNQYSFSNGLTNVATGNGVSCTVPSGLMTNNNDPESEDQVEASSKSANLQPEETGIQWLEKQVNGEFNYFSFREEQKQMARHDVYRILRLDPTLQTGSEILSAFFKETETTNMAALADVENLLASNQLKEAKTLLNRISFGNSVDENYMNFYHLYINSKTDAFTQKDSLQLFQLANGCAIREGKIVYKARALYGLRYNEYKIYNDNCAQEDPVLKDVIESNISVYPNPNNGTFKIQLHGNTVENISLEVTVMDLQGKIVNVSELKAEKDHVMLNLKLSKGIYVVLVKDEKGKTYNPEKITVLK